ncbi:hypothetical protein [Croceicoccus gelatinilyticus]|uniref:hypothetical protein n=1 Tax=Croceicoccus gelatinilyticus TaxID=2835536 RepID=UPI001BCF190A|nr:hypothetical protein [Croceicoccus gelatinilyticus]MBS7671036.1 hypothetical protein [Croceicoccus gelatinilyticus]
MNGNAPTSDQMTPASQACFRFWFDDAESAADILARHFGADTLPITIKRNGMDLHLAPASGNIDTPQYIATNPIDLPDGPSLELRLVEGGSASFLTSVKALSALAAEIARSAQAKAIGWSEAGTITGSEFFIKVVQSWEDGGAFPAMVLVALQGDGDGGLITRGLSPFCEQELVLDLAPMPMPEQAKIAIRMIDHLAAEGAVTENEIVEVDGFGSFELDPRDSGKKIYLRRSPFP